jgi:hypothetical protein
MSKIAGSNSSEQYKSKVEENKMKIASSIARLLLGLIFLVFALNGFLHFIPMPPPTGLAGQFMGALFAFRRSGHWRTAALVSTAGNCDAQGDRQLCRKVSDHGF